MNSIFEDWFTSCSNHNYKTMENEDEYILMIETPGIPKEDIKISVIGKYLSISGKSDWKNIDYKFSFPSDSDYSCVSASAVDGILTVKVGKTKKKEPEFIQVL